MLFGKAAEFCPVPPYCSFLTVLLHYFFKCAIAALPQTCFDSQDCRNVHPQLLLFWPCSVLFSCFFAASLIELTAKFAPVR